MDDVSVNPKLSLRLRIGQLFTPATPINDRDLFAGRPKQIHRIIDAISQRGQHAIVFGERGVGKTSLANVLAAFLEGIGMPIIAPRVNCDSSDSYSSLWQRIFSQIRVSTRVESMGLRPEVTEQIISLAENMPDPINPDSVRVALAGIAGRCVLILIIDEFDRFADFSNTRLFADTIKVLSDYAIPATLILVGVADSVDTLISGHESIMRNLVQVPMPRMSVTELQEIIRERLPKVPMTISEDSLEKICILSRGLPHYTHLIAQHAAWVAIENGDSEICERHVAEAMSKAIQDSQQTIQKAYHRATMSPRKDNLFAEVLLACALARCDEYGYFAAADVRAPMTAIMGKEYDIPSFMRHLKDFCRTTRGPVLREIGEKYQRRFRFENPLMQPHVIIRGVADSRISLSQVKEFAKDVPV